MTTDAPTRQPAGRRRGYWALLCVVLAVGCADSNKSRRGDQVDVSSYPPDVQAAYPVFAVRCSRCHTLARPLNARITDPQHWIRYVNRMRLQPGSGIDAHNGEIILRFLLYYHGHRDQGHSDQGHSDQGHSDQGYSDQGHSDGAAPATGGGKHD